jgi:hypothetical protein
VCGGTRAFLSVLHGHLAGAVRDNVVLLLVVVVMLVGFAPGLRGSRIGKIASAKLSGRSPWLWVGLIVAWTIARNMPGLLWLSPDR